MLSRNMVDLMVKNKANGRHNDSCCDKFIKCMSLVPCPTLLAWILLLLGIGCLTGGLLIGTRDTRTLLDDQDLLWFMEYTVIGVSSGMFIVGCLFLLAAHLSSEPTSRRVFNSFRKNKCAQGMNIFALVVCYFLAVCWVLATTIFATPLVLIINMLIQDSDSVDLGIYGFKGGVKTGTYLNTFKEESKDLLICWGIVFCSSFLIVNSL
ncbi:neuronal membrane glycoprotein m6-b, partial [Plakobranchus ocellatus]